MKFMVLGRVNGRTPDRYVHFISECNGLPVLFSLRWLVVRPWLGTSQVDVGLYVRVGSS
jgi:hypothetical protein